jgi:hypothetical protein
MGFLKEDIEAAGENWPDVAEMNACLDRLVARRALQVAGEPEHLPSTEIVWRYVVLEEGLLYRIVALASGCADSWTARNPLVSVLVARALIETVALLHRIDRESALACETQDRLRLISIANEEMFASRLKEWIPAEHRPAPSILTAVDRLDRELKGLRDHYDFLSEICHPNGLGHYHFFASFDRTTGLTRFSDLRSLTIHTLRHILASYMLVTLAEETFVSLLGRRSLLTEIQSNEFDTEN